MISTCLSSAGPILRRTRIARAAFVIGAIKALLLFHLGMGFAQNVRPEAIVKAVSGTTSNSITCRASVAKATFRRGEDIHINYHVTNDGKSAIYLVVEPWPSVFVDDRFTIHLLPPVKPPNDYDRYDFDLIRIRSHGSAGGTITLRAGDYQKSGEYDFSITEIQVGFSFYMSEYEVIARCKKAGGARPCLAELYSGSESLSIGNLVVSIGD